MAAPDDVLIGLDVGKEEHYTDVLDDARQAIFGRAVANDQAALQSLIDRATEHGTPGRVIESARLDRPTRDRGGGQSRCAGCLCARAGEPGFGPVSRRGKDRPARRVRAGRHRPEQASSGPLLDTGSDELLDQLRILSGFDIDLAADVFRLTNRIRHALTSISPALERVLGSRLDAAGVRDLLATWAAPTALRGGGA